MISVKAVDKTCGTCEYHDTCLELVTSLDPDEGCVWGTTTWRDKNDERARREPRENWDTYLKVGEK